MKQTPSEIKAGLAQFTGTQNWHRIYPHLLLTDGAKYLAEACQCYWLMDIAFSIQTIQKVKAEPMQLIKLVMTGENTATVFVTDGNKNLLYKKDLPFTDFPLPDGIILWVVSAEGRNRVIMLPSEY